MSDSTICMGERSTPPSPPASGQVKFWFTDDNRIGIIDDAGTVTYIPVGGIAAGTLIHVDDSAITPAGGFSTFSITPVQAHTLAFTADEAADYVIDWFYVWSHDDAASDFIARVQLDDATELIPSDSNEHRQEPKEAGGVGDGGTDQRHVASGRSVVALAAGAHFVDIDIWTSNGADESTLHHGFISVTKITP